MRATHLPRALARARELCNGDRVQRLWRRSREHADRTGTGIADPGRLGGRWPHRAARACRWRSHCLARGREARGAPGLLAVVAPAADPRALASRRGEPRPARPPGAAEPAARARSRRHARRSRAERVDPGLLRLLLRARPTGDADARLRGLGSRRARCRRPRSG